MSTCNTEQFIGQGKVYVAPRASNGAINGGWTFLGDTPRLEVNTTQDFVDDYESCSGNRSLALHIPIQTDWEMSLDTKSFSKENLARAFYGTATAVLEGTATGEVVKCYATDQIIPLAHPGVSAVVVKQGATTVSAADYVVDAVNGTITFTNVANLTGTGPYTLAVDYSYAAHEKMAAGTQTIAEYAFRFEGINLATKKAVIAQLHRVSLNMAETLSLIGTEVGLFSMSGGMLADPSAGVGDSAYMTIIKAV